MGIQVDNNAFETFELLKDLEKARNDLHEKQKEVQQGSQAESAENTQGLSNQLAIEWAIEEER